VLDVDGYLRRLHVSHPGPPAVDRLFALHRAHAAIVPYENLEIQLGRPTTIDPYDSAERIIAGGGGYCFHLNGAFALLLETLGYDVSRHVGGVFSRRRTPTEVGGDHLALTVRLGEQSWFVDVGLGNALYEPMPLQAGLVRQGPFFYRLEPSPIVAGGWRFRHAENAESFAGMDFGLAAVTMDAFTAKHRELSTSPTSTFVNVAQVGRRTATGFDFLFGCYCSTYDETGLHKRVLTCADEWFGVVSDVFGLPMADLDAVMRAALWKRLWAGHERHIASFSNTAPG
jgi:N-hydroxyarylamine O-acetyltransferase